MTETTSSRTDPLPNMSLTCSHFERKHSLLVFVSYLLVLYLPRPESRIEQTQQQNMCSERSYQRLINRAQYYIYGQWKYIYSKKESTAFLSDFSLLKGQICTVIYRYCKLGKNIISKTQLSLINGATCLHFVESWAICAIRKILIDLFNDLSGHFSNRYRMVTFEFMADTNYTQYALLQYVRYV